MNRFDFSESEAYLSDNETCHKINEKIDKLILTNMANNSCYLNLYYLRIYMSTVITRYISILHKNNKIKNREDMQKTIDEIMAGVLVVLSDFQFHNQLYIAISLFINQILLLMYDGIDDFCVSPAPIFNHIVNYEDEEIQFRNGIVAIIEPLVISEDKKQVQDMNTALNIINTMNELFDYDAKVFKVHIAVIISSLWVQDATKIQMIKNSKIDEIIPNNNINLDDFAEFRKLLLKNEYNIEIIYDNDDNDNVVDDIHHDYYPEEEKIEEDNIIESTSQPLEEELNYNMLVSLEYMSKEITNIFSVINNVPKESVVNNSVFPDGIVYESLYNYINNDKSAELDIHMVNATVNGIYGSDDTIKKENKKDTKTSKNKEKITKNDEFQPINTDKNYTPYFDTDGYTSYVGDCVNADTNKFVIDFVSYMKDILSILKNQGTDYKKKMIYEIADKYNHCNDNNTFTVGGITKKKDIFNVKIIYNDAELVLTIPNKDDIISNIRYRKLENKHDA